MKEYKARVIGAILRHNDSEDKLIAAPEGMSFTKEEAEKAVRFQEQYFESETVFITDIRSAKNKTDN